MQNNAWNTTAVLLTYDNSGGWYDHVAPPTLNPSAPGLPLTGTAQSLGLRVPAILIGPYARPGAVDHQQLDFTSILRFIEQNWHLAPLTARDATAASIGSGLNMQQAPIPAHIVSAPSPAEAFVRPHVTVIYGLYLGALAIVAMLVLAAIRSNRRMAGRSPVRAGVTATSQI
jgi:phospholipase C